MNPPQNVGFRTPPKPAAGPSLSKAEKQRLLDNLELEGVLTILLKTLLRIDGSSASSMIVF
jgi:hypothetical protein